MTKKKIDEAATLTIYSEKDGMTANTTITANDTLGLASILKNAGIAGNSEAVTGSATLTTDVEGPTGSVYSTIQSPDLRSIMNLLEPEFKILGDMENEINSMSDEDSYDECNCGEEEFTEEANYDYRTADVSPKEYGSSGSRDVVQPKTHYVPARSGDNPIDDTFEKMDESDDKSFLDYLKEAEKRNLDEAKANPYVKYYHNSDDELAGYVSSDGYHKKYWRLSDRGLAAAKKHAGVDEISEDLHSSDPASVWISDFEKSKNPKFDGKSKEERKKMALGAYYSAQNESEDLDEYDLSLTRTYPNNEKGARQAFVDSHRYPDDAIVGISKRSNNVWKVETNDKRTHFITVKHNDGDEIEEASLNRMNLPKFYMNTDMGYANLISIKDGTAPYWEAGYDKGFIILEIDRNGKKGLNYLWGTCSEKEGTNVIAVTHDKKRPAKVIMKISLDELENDYEGVVDRLKSIGLTPIKKLPVKGFD